MFRSQSCGELTDVELMAAVKNNNEGAIDALLCRYKKLVKSRARSYFLIGGDREDLVQEGMIGLLKAAQDFNPDVRVSFRAFAGLCVTRQIITAIKNATRQKHLPLNSYISLDGFSEDNGSERVFETAAKSVSGDPVESVLAAERLKHIMEVTSNCLTLLESTVLRGYVGGRSYREIALALNCRPKAVDNALQRIKRKISVKSNYPA